MERKKNLESRENLEQSWNGFFQIQVSNPRDMYRRFLSKN